MPYIPRHFAVIRALAYFLSISSLTSQPLRNSSARPDFRPGMRPRGISISGLNFVAVQARVTGRPTVASLSLGGGISTALDNAVIAVCTPFILTIFFTF